MLGANAAHAPGPPPKDHADLLRMVGGVLDLEHAVEAEVALTTPQLEHGDFSLTLSWRDELGRYDHRVYHADDLAHLQTSARERRGTPTPMAAGLQAELFRTLGQELDREGTQLRHLRHDGRGFWVLAGMDDEEIHHYYSSDELQQLSHERQTTRR